MNAQPIHRPSADTAQNDPEREFVECLRRGEEQAIRRLFESWHGRLFAYLVSTGAESAAAEELVQETFVRVLRFHSQLRSGSSPQAWLFGIARNLARNRRRSVFRRREEELDPEVDLEQASAPSHEESVLSRHDLEAALAELSSEQREALVLSRLIGLQQSEVAQVLGCSEGAVKLRVHRGMGRLKERFASQVGRDSSHD